MDNLINIIEIIGKYGLPTVCAGVVIFLFLYMFRKQQQQLNLLLESTHKEHPDDEDTEALDVINDKIYGELRSILETSLADRAYVFLYHNGGISSSGLFFQRMSCICEVVSAGVLPMTSEFQNLHKAAYSSMCNSLRSQGHWYVDDVETLKSTDPFMYQTLAGRHVEAMYVKALKDARGGVIGFIGIDYCSLSRNPTSEKVCSDLKSASLRVASLVDIRDEMK